MWEKDSSTKEYKSIAFCCERLPTFHQVICPWKVSLGRCPVLSTRDVPSGLQRPCQTEHVQPTGKNQVPFALGKTKLLRKKKTKNNQTTTLQLFPVAARKCGCGEGNKKGETRGCFWESCGVSFWCTKVR